MPCSRKSRAVITCGRSCREELWVETYLNEARSRHVIEMIGTKGILWLARHRLWIDGWLVQTTA
jgi:hypothetical protein